MGRMLPFSSLRRGISPMRRLNNMDRYIHCTCWLLMRSPTQILEVQSTCQIAMSKSRGRAEDLPSLTPSFHGFWKEAERETAAHGKGVGEPVEWAEAIA